MSLEVNSIVKLLGPNGGVDTILKRLVTVANSASTKRLNINGYSTLYHQMTYLVSCGIK